MNVSTGEWTLVLVHQAIRPIIMFSWGWGAENNAKTSRLIILFIQGLKATCSRFQTTPLLPSSLLFPFCSWLFRSPSSLLFPFYSPWNGMVSPRLPNQVAEGSAQHLGTGPMSYMISLWQDQTSLMASGVPIPAPRGSPAGPNLDFYSAMEVLHRHNSCIYL